MQAAEIERYAFFDELQKIGAALTETERAQIPKKQFALTPKQSTTGKRAYPMHDEHHARLAIAFVGMHGSPEQKSEVYKDVQRLYPHIAEKSAPIQKWREQQGTPKTAEKEGPMPWRDAAIHGLHHEGPGALGMTAGAMIGSRYGHPLEGAGLGYGLGAGAGLLGDAIWKAIKERRVSAKQLPLPFAK